MKLTISVLVCLGTALAHLPLAPLPWAGEELELGQSLEEQKEFRHGRELKYIYNGQSMTGIPGTSKQHGGNRIQAKVTIVCKHQQTCVLKIDEVRMGKLNRDIKKPRHVLPMNAFDPTPLEPKQRRMLHLPVKFSIDGGLINNIVFDGEEKPWSANLKRGVLNMMQVNLQKQKPRTDVDIVDAIEEQMINVYKSSKTDASFYRTIEETIEGECETIYTVTKPPMFKSSRQPIFNVTKTINFEKCLKRPQVKYNFHFSEPCPSSDTKYNEDQKFLKSSSITSYQVVKTPRFNIISNAHTESEYVFVPFNEEANAVVTYVSQNLKLIKAGLAMRRIPVPVNPQKSDSDMLYSLDHEIAQELFQMEGDASSLEQIVYRKHQNKVQVAVNLLRKLVNNIREEVQEPATKHFVQLVNLFRILSKAQIERVHNAVSQGAAIPQFTPHQQKIAKDLLHDALSTAGTKPAVQHIVHKIKRREISIPKSISAVSNLKTIPTPSKEIIQELISLAESSVAQRHYMLKQITWLTIGTLMKGLCSNDADQWAREQKEPLEKLCPKTLKEQYVKILVKRLHSSHQWDDKLIYIKALGNAGLDLSVFDLEQIIHNKNFNYKTMIRVEAVLALRQLRTVMPKKIQKVLMPVVSNVIEPETLRISAAYMILQTMPSRPVLDQLAKVAQNEHNIQVASFIDSYMNSMANSTNPCEKKLATDLKLSLRQMHTVYARTLGVSKFLRVPMHSKHQKVGFDLDFTSTFTDRNPVPRQIAATLHSNFLGFWNKYLVSLRLATEGLDKVLRRSSGIFGTFGLFDFDNGYDNVISSVNTLEEAIKDPVSQDPKAVLSLKLKNQDTAFLPLKRHTIQSLLLSGFPTGQGLYLEEKLRQGVIINHNKAGMADEIHFHVPTTLGMPVMVHVKVPYVINVHGAVKMNPSQGGSLRSFQIKAALKPSIVSSITIDIKTWSPVVSSGVKVVNKVKAFQPIDAKLLISLRGQTKVAKLLFKPPVQRKDLLTLESRPSTYANSQPSQPQSYEDKQKRLILGEEGNRRRTVHECNTCGLLGTRFCAKGQYHKTPEYRPTGAPFTPLSGPNKIVISVEPSFNKPRTVAINLYSKWLIPISSMSLSGGLFNSPVLSMKEEFLSMVNLPTSTMYSEPLYDELMAETSITNNYPSRNPQYRHNNVKKPVANSLRLEVETSNQRHLKADLVHVFNMDGDYHKVHGKVALSPSPERPYPWKTCLNAETILPTLAMIRQLSSREVIGKLSITWGHSCQSPNFVQIVKRIEKGRRSRMHELQNPEWRVHRDANMNHDELLRKSPIKYIFDIKYNNVPLKTKHYANEVLRYIKKRHYDQTNVAEVAVYNRPQHVKIIVAIDPVTYKKCDVLIKTPKSNTLIRDLTMPSYVSPVTHKRDYVKNEKKHLARESRFVPTSAQCYATEFKVKTFIDKEVPMPLSSSYKVLAKDCGSNKYTVLVRQLPEYNSLKEVKIISRMNQIVLKPSATRPTRTKVFVNGRDHTSQSNIVKTEAGLPILKIVKQSGHIKVELLDVGVSIYFDRKSVNVEVPGHKRHRQCGMCGHGRLDQMKLPSLLSPALEAEVLTEKIASDSLQFEPRSGIFEDFTTPENTLRYYFGISPAQSMIEQMAAEQMLVEQIPWSNSAQQRLLIEEIEDELEPGMTYIGNPYERNQGWSKPSERLWEVDEVSSDRQFMELDAINADFNSVYSPLDVVEQQIEEQLLQDVRMPISTPSRSSLTRTTWDDQYEILTDELEQKAEREELIFNPYLSNSYLVDQESCSYMPFWQRQRSPDCQDIFTSAFDMERGLDNIESEFKMENVLGQMVDSDFGPNILPLTNEIPGFGLSPLQRPGANGEIREQIVLDALAEEDSGETLSQEMSNELEKGEYAGRQQKIVETEHSICFSKIPTRCTENTYASHEIQRHVPYHCMSRKNPRANKYLNEIMSGRKFIPQIASKPTTMTRVEQVPVGCRPSF